MKKFLTAAFLMTLSTLLYVFAPDVHAETAASYVCDWYTFNFPDTDEVGLFSEIQGYTLTEDAKVVSYPSLEMYVTQEDVFFKIRNQEGSYITNNTDAPLTNDIIMSMETMNLNEVISAVTLGSGNTAMLLGQETNLSGLTMSPRQMMVNEMMSGGDVRLWVPMMQFDGFQNVYLYFDLPQSDYQFYHLYTSAVDNKWKQASGSGAAAKNGQAAGETSRAAQTYTNDEIVSICQNYIDQYNNIAPKVSRWYDLVFGDGELETSDYASIGITIFEMLLSDDPEQVLEEKMAGPLTEIVEFYEAKTAFEELDTSKMTSDQKSYYSSTAEEMNRTDIVKILNMVEQIFNALN